MTATSKVTDTWKRSWKKSWSWKRLKDHEPWQRCDQDSNFYTFSFTHCERKELRQFLSAVLAHLFCEKNVDKFYKNVLLTKNNFQRVQKDGIKHFPCRHLNKYYVLMMRESCKMQGILKQSIEAGCWNWICVLRFFTRSGLHTCSESSSFLFQNFGNISLHIFWGYVAGIQEQKFLLEKGTLHRITT